MVMKGIMFAVGNKILFIPHNQYEYPQNIIVPHTVRIQFPNQQKQ